MIFCTVRFLKSSKNDKRISSRIVVSKQLYFNELNMLKKGKDYIFYHSYDYYSSQLSPYLNELIYANAQKIYFIEKIDRTYVAKVKL